MGNKLVVLERVRRIFLIFASVFLVSGIGTCIRYNWKFMSDLERIAIPLFFIVLSLVCWRRFKEKLLYRQIALVLAVVFAGIFFFVYKELYLGKESLYLVFTNLGIVCLFLTKLEKVQVVLVTMALSFAVSAIVYIQTYSQINFLGLVYNEFEFSLYVGAVIMFSFYTLYIVGVKRGVLEPNKWSFYLVTLSLMALLTVGLTGTIVRNNGLSLEFIISSSFYCLIVAATVYLNKLYENSSGVKVLAITSAVLATSAFVLSYYGSDILSKYIATFRIFIIVCIFLAGLFTILRRFKHSRLIGFVTNFFKIFLIIFGVFFFVSLMKVFQLEYGAYLLAGALLLFSSIELPRRFKFGYEGVEIISFIIGLILIFLDLSQAFNIPYILSVLIIWGIYGTFWWKWPSYVLDFLLVPIVLWGVYASSIVGWENENIFMLLCLAVLLMDVMGVLKKGKAVARVVKGAEVSAMIVSFVAFSSTYFSIVNALIVLIALLYLYKILEKKNKGIFSIVTICFLLAEVLVSNILGGQLLPINLGLMLVLVYLYKQDNFLLGISNIYFFAQLGILCTDLYPNLLYKSYVLFGMGIVLFVGFYVFSKILTRKRLAIEKEE